MEVRGKEINHYICYDLPELLNPGDLLIFNNSKVIPAKLKATLQGKKFEFYLSRIVNNNVWIAIVRKFKKLKIGDIFVIAEDFKAKIIDKKATDIGEITIEFIFSNGTFFEKLEEYGEIPLPPYIDRKNIQSDNDKIDYQNIFAKYEGSVAAPTAGLHFTKELFESLDKKGIKKDFITLHVGAGTFLPVKSENISEHVMHYEYCTISQETADLINETKAKGNNIISVGTTSMRTIESAVDENGLVKPFKDNTNLFITPGYKFKVIDQLITNFHLPKSTLFILVCAFAGFENMHNAYKIAKEQKYRFFSYGDCCLLHLNKD